MTSTEDPVLFSCSTTNPQDAGLLEELCETLILTIVMVLWKGVAGADEEAWTVRFFTFYPSYFYNWSSIFHIESWANIFGTSISLS